jgi:enoyl-CoA hydratase/carnithine racemase
MWCALREALDRIGSDFNIRVVAIRGDGDDAFVSGGDISVLGSIGATPKVTRNTTAQLTLHASP